MSGIDALFLADGFYEWQPVSGGPKQPFHITRADGSPFAFAGLWSIWHAPDGDTLRTCTILTTSANSAIRSLHDRMPIILAPDAERLWLDPGTPQAELGEILAGLPASRPRSGPWGSRSTMPATTVPSASPQRPNRRRPPSSESTTSQCPSPPCSPPTTTSSLDLDGCVWISDEPTRRAPDAIAALRAAHKSLAFLTNDAQHSPEEYVRKLWSLGIQASLEEIVTVGAAIQYVLAERGTGAGVYVIGAPAIFRHVTIPGSASSTGPRTRPRPRSSSSAATSDVHFADLGPAIRSVLAGAQMIAGGRDRTYPTAEGIAPGTGAVIAALEYATDRTATIVGKPDKQIFVTALDRLGPGRTLVIGDRLDADLGGAAAAGLDGAIVLTGVTSAAQAAEAEDPAPVAVASDLYALVTGG